MNIEAIDFLNRLNESGSIAYADYSHLHDLLTSEEPQGEPSDAQVFAFIRGYYPLTHAKMQGHWSDNSIERVRDGLCAALRAAMSLREGGVR